MTSSTESLAVKQKPDAAELSIALVSGLAIALTAIFICASPLTNQIAGARDFVTYWATGQQLIHHANPYDPVAMSRLEHAAGLPAIYSVGFMRNPPWGLVLALPLGMVGVRLGTLLWSAILFACLMGSVRMLWDLHGRPRGALHWLGYSFAPALLCLLMGQTTIFALLGLVLFLRLYRHRPFLAGMSLWLCALKPHLFLAFGIVLLAWIAVTGSYKMLAGAAIAMAASCAAVWLIDPLAWTQYAEMMRGSGIEKESIPCLAVMLRLWTRPSAMSLQYLPALLGCLWALGYYWRRRRSWDWSTGAGLLIVVSLFSAPYCYLYDHALAIPALMQGIYRTRVRSLLVVLAGASLLLEVEWACGLRLTSPLYLWAAPAWLGWYLAACATPAKVPEAVSAQ